MLFLVTSPATEPDRAVDRVTRQPADSSIEHCLEEDRVGSLSIFDRAAGGAVFAVKVVVDKRGGEIRSERREDVPEDPRHARPVGVKTFRDPDRPDR